jgi:hypothetical protein
MQSITARRYHCAGWNFSTNSTEMEREVIRRSAIKVNVSSSLSAPHLFQLLLAGQGQEDAGDETGASEGGAGPARDPALLGGRGQSFPWFGLPEVLAILTAARFPRHQLLDS